MAKIKEGDEIGAGFLNGHEEAAEWYRRFKARGEGGALRPTPVNFSKVMGANYTGQQIYIGDVCEFDGNPFSDPDPAENYPDPRNDRWLKAVTPDTTRVGWGIALDPISDATGDDREGGEFLVLGVCHAKVQILDEDHEYAERKDGERKLYSAASGPVKILHKPAGGTPPEERLCLVQIMDEGGGSDIVWFKLAEPLYLDGTLSSSEWFPTAVPIPNHAKAYKWLGDGEYDTDNPIEVFDVYGDIGIPGQRMFNGLKDFAGCAVRRSNYESDGETGLFRLKLDFNWWGDAGSITLDIGGDTTSAITWPHSTGPQDGTAFAANLSAAINTAITPDICAVRIIYDKAPNEEPVFEVTFDTVGDRTTTVTAWSHDGTGSEPTIETLRSGADAEVPVSRSAYDIIWMERPAQWLEFVTAGYMGEYADLRCTAVVTLYDNQGVMTDPLGADTNVVDVWDSDDITYPVKRFPDVHNGAKGYATYDNRRNRYVIQQCQRVGIFAAATFSGTWCPGGGDLPISSFTILPTGDYVGSPVVTPKPLNPLDIPAINGDKVLFRRTSQSLINTPATDPLSNWEVTGVQQHSVSVVTNVSEEDDGLYRHRSTIYANICSTTETPELIIEVNECPAPE